MLKREILFWNKQYVNWKFTKGILVECMASGSADIPTRGFENDCHIWSFLVSARTVWLSPRECHTKPFSKLRLVPSLCASRQHKQFRFIERSLTSLNIINMCFTHVRSSIKQDWKSSPVRPVRGVRSDMLQIQTCHRMSLKVSDNKCCWYKIRHKNKFQRNTDKNGVYILC